MLNYYQIAIVLFKLYIQLPNNIHKKNLFLYKIVSFKYIKIIIKYRFF